MNKTYDLELPHLLVGDARGNLNVFDRRLYGSDHHFIRFDLYPLLAPSHMKRHYGWWDVPLEHIRQERTPFVFDFSQRIIRISNRNHPIEIAQGWRGPIEEKGYCMLHVSLWDKSKEPPQMIQMNSQPVVIATGSTGLPLKQINIPITDRCNLKCTMCPRQSTEDLIEIDIPDDTLQCLIDSSRDLSCVLLQGLGEPLLYKNICNVVRLLKGKMRENSEIGLTSNATLLNEQTALKLLDSEVDFLYFSVDAATKSTYEAIRVGADFEAVIANISRCVQYRGSTHKPRFMMNFVITRQNHYEIAAFAQLAAELGIENVTYSHCLSAQSGTMEIADKKDVLLSQFERAREVAEKNGVNIYFPPLEKTKEEKCFFMERAVVLAQGDVVPCHAMAPGYRARERSKVFGNVRRKALEEIWNQPDYTKFRQRVLVGDYPDECAGCECKAYLVP
jgi:Fe-coproporphyrin III synthase